MADVKARWLASLSDGSTAIEGVPPFDTIKGEDKPWPKLQKHLKDNNLTITGMRIQVSKDDEAVRTYVLPSIMPAGAKGKFRSKKYASPLGYTVNRIAEGVLFSGEYHQEGGFFSDSPKMRITRTYLEVAAIFGLGGVLSIMIDELDGTDCYIVPHKVG